MAFDRLKRWFIGPEVPERSPVSRTLAGRVRVGDQEWLAREERRAGPLPQLLILTLAGQTGSQMQLRFAEEEQVRSLEDISTRAHQPSERSFLDAADACWQARIATDDEGITRIKFIHWPSVHEGSYPFEDGLGLRSDDELRALLDGLRAASTHAMKSRDDSRDKEG